MVTAPLRIPRHTCLSKAQLRPCQQYEDELPTTLKTTSQTPAPKTPEPSGSALQQLLERPFHISPSTDLLGL